jgi:hypothetical protein
MSVFCEEGALRTEMLKLRFIIDTNTRKVAALKRHF